MQSWWAEETFKHILLTPNRVFVTHCSAWMNWIRNSKWRSEELNTECVQSFVILTRGHRCEGLVLECAINSQRLQTRSLMCRPTVGLVRRKEPLNSHASVKHGQRCWCRSNDTHLITPSSAASHFNNHSNYKHVPYLTSSTYSAKAQRIRDLHSCIYPKRLQDLHLYQ